MRRASTLAFPMKASKVFNGLLGTGKASQILVDALIIKVLLGKEQGVKKQALLLPAAVHCACARPDSRPAQCSCQFCNAASADAAIAGVALEAFAMLFGDGNPPAG